MHERVKARHGVFTQTSQFDQKAFSFTKKACSPYPAEVAEVTGCNALYF